MKYYYVDLTSLPPDQRIKEADQLDTWSFFSHKQFEGENLVGIKIYWEKEEDFLSSGLVPKGCPCRLIY